MLTPDATHTAYEALIARVAAWAEAEPGIRAALIVGSRARTERPADAWSDLDLVLFATDPDRWLHQTDWIAGFGEVCLTLIEPTATAGGLERRVLYRDAIDVDFSIFPVAAVDALSQDAGARGVLARGVRVLLDKDALLERLTAGAPPPTAPSLPDAAQIEQDANDFWYHALWTAKKLRRGELWTAHRCCDGYMKALLLRLMEWHARATHGGQLDTWHAGRFVEQWADPRALTTLRDAFARYDETGIWHALFATTTLYSRLAQELGTRSAFLYPLEADQEVTAVILELYSERPRDTARPDAPRATANG